MKTELFISSVLLCLACNSTSNRQSDEAAITKLLDNESHFAAKGDLAQWASCWVDSDATSFIYTSAGGVETLKGFKPLAQAIGEIEPFELKLARDNYNFEIGDDIAFVGFDQQDNWGGADHKKKETRTLRKVNGEWKIVHSTVVNLSSFDQQSTASWHMPVSKFPKNPRNGFQNLSGLGGMSVGYMEVPGPADFTPFFEGLPGNMCSSPHWGYVIDGALKVRYPGGKEETVNAGEVFYWPAPHTGVVEKNVKFIDISPDGKFIPVMDHLAKKMAQASSQ
ncbi:hypothetical protein [Agriterribacter sp.]|mgnify:CR=1 FL=1|uniref:hypothetical protein n=1 Tax=Agriterribacter sp. TaxID=2821509 RepID=UPI002BB10B1D|nr:hypothetical protein [Agriterribacter sp.]HRO45499.1 hypothetical protein [Agriterribacter sp.]HRQ19046.1 hypothetical protein [Agriterribacter sp.]